MAVSFQTNQEAVKFGIEAHRITHKPVKGINIINYDKLHYLDYKDYGGIVADESSILKSFDGATSEMVIEFMRKIPYRLLTTATAAPNDYIELGTSSQALGHLGAMDMLNRFFKNDNNNSGMRRMYGEQPKWRFKGHAEIQFWRWVCSWARAIRKPSDLGFSDDKFILPPLKEVDHFVESENKMDGFLFSLPANSLSEQREERKTTINERCERVSELLNHKNPAMAWCHLNNEGDLLGKIIPGAVQISGSDSDEEKEEKFTAFSKGQIRVLVTKPKIGAWGLNFQHCAHMTFFPSHSYEQYYQAVRRCWRFGQKKEVVVDIVTTAGEEKVLKNLQRKSKAADKMFNNLVSEMNNSIKIKQEVFGKYKEELPSWL